VKASNDVNAFFAEIQQLARQNLSDAQLLLAFMHAPTTIGRWRFIPSHTSVSEKNRTFIDWLSRSAEGGNLCAMSLLGLELSSGLPGVPVDMFNAEHWLRSAAYAGDKAAPKVLLQLAAVGELIPTQNDLLNWSTTAAEDGDPKLRLQTAAYFLEAQDRVSAYLWTLLALRAVSLDDTAAFKEVFDKYQEIGSGMTAEQMQESARRANAWRPSHEMACNRFLKDLETSEHEVDKLGQ
jgi:TPR repeat protein